MGRSVWTQSDSICDVFRWLDSGGYCEHCEMLTYAGDNNKCDECGAELAPDDDGDYSQSEFDDFVYWVRDALSDKFPSFNKADSWPERESHCILENELAQIVISEYCGLVSLGVVPTGDTGYYQLDGLARAWCMQNVVPFVRETWGELQRVATMSNGESVYIKG